MRISDWSSDVCSSDLIEEITEFDPLTGKKIANLNYVRVFANSHYVTPGPTLKQASEAIRHELTERLKELEAEGRLLEAQRLEQRTNFDLEMIAATGSCAGIENYSRSEERRGGKEWVRTCRARWSPVHEKNKTKQ